MSIEKAVFQSNHSLSIPPFPMGMGRVPFPVEMSLCHTPLSLLSTHRVPSLLSAGTTECEYSSYIATDYCRFRVGSDCEPV